MNGFSGLDTALSALRASQQGMAVAGQNLAGAGTEGYVRRRAEITTVGAAPGVSRIQTGAAPTMQGVTSSVSRLGDQVLDDRARTEQARGAAADGASATMAAVETVFAEPSTTGLASQLDTLWNSFGTVDASSGAGTGSDGPGAAVLSAAQSAASWLNRAAQSLSDRAADAGASLTSTVSTVGDLSAQLARVNSGLRSETAAGHDVTDLQDQRDQIAQQLATLVGGRTTLGDSGTATVTVGGATLVDGSVAAAVAGTSVAPMTADATTGAVTVGGTAVTLDGGSAAADAAAITTTVPRFRGLLDGVAAQLATTTTTALAAGYDASGAAGGPLFTSSSGPVTAATIGVAITDPARLGLSTVAGGRDTGVAQQLSQAGTAPSGPDASYRSLVLTVGTDSARAQGVASAQHAATNAAVSARTSAEGVSSDEELTSLLTFQRSYQAASRVLTTMDDVLDTLINRTGRVGL